MNALKDEILKRWDMAESWDFRELLKNKWWGSIGEFYMFATERAPLLWQIVFTLLDINILNDLVKKYLRTVSQNMFNKFVRKYEPDVIISLYPLWPAFIENYIEKYGKTFETGVIVTDSMEIYIWWYVWSKIVDHYFLIDSFTKKVFKDRFKHKKNNIHVSFFPIKPEYFLDKPQITTKTIAFLLSWLKKPFVEDLIQRLVFESGVEKIIVIWWRNIRLYNYLKKTFSNEKISFLEFPNIKELLKDIDVFIAKPGWAILSECIAQDVVLIAPNFIPGQEEWNVNFMKQAKVWIYEPEPEKIIECFRNINFNDFLPNFHEIKN